MIRAVLQGDVPKLREPAAEVERFDDELYDLLADLHDTVIAERGLGLSAVQIGISKRVFVTNIGDARIEFVNPLIRETSGESLEYESCLSLPDHTFKVLRPEKIRVDAYRRDGTPFELVAEGWLARVICHEVDHLNGILLIDHVTEEELLLDLLENAFVDEEIDEIADLRVDARDEPINSDVQMALDFLADAVWKATLSAHVFEDELRSSAMGSLIQRINTCTEEMNEILDILERELGLTNPLGEWE